MADNQFRLIQLEAENVKRLKAVRVDFAEGLTVIGGNNGAGKSSVIDAIYYALAGAASIPGVPVRVGQDQATIAVTLDGAQRLIVKRKIRADGGSTLSIEQVTADGIPSKVTSPQRLLDSLLGALAFDPLAFVRLAPKDQAEMLRGIVGVSVDDLDAKISDLYAERTGHNAEAKRLMSQLSAMPEHADAPEAEIAIKDLVSELEAATEHNREVDRLGKLAVDALSETSRMRQRVDALKSRVADLKQQLADAIRLQDEGEIELKAQQEKAKAASDAFEEAQTVDCEPIRAKIDGAEAINGKVRANRDRLAKAEELKAASKRGGDLTLEIERLRKERVDRMSAATWPVDGLGFGANGVEYQGLPFDQCSSAEQLRISTAIALSQNPRLPLGFIRDGSLLDRESLSLVESMARAAGAQLIVERVGDGAECSIVIDDGEVATIAGQAVEETPEAATAAG